MKKVIVLNYGRPTPDAEPDGSSIKKFAIESFRILFGKIAFIPEGKDHNDETYLTTVDGCLYYDGIFYSDIWVAEDSEWKVASEAFEYEKAKLPSELKREYAVQDIVSSLKGLDDGAGVDGETMQHILEEVAMDTQMHRQLVLSLPAEDTEVLLEELAELNGDNSPSKIKEDRAFIIAAVSLDLIEVINENHAEWLDNHGYQPYYDLVVAIVDEMMFTEGSAYLRFLEKKKENKKINFTEFVDDCFDWYHMRLARKMVTEDLLDAVCYGSTVKYFEDIRAKKFYELGVDEGEEGTRTLKSFDTKEEAEALKTELEGMFPAMKLFVDTCTYDYITGRK